MADNRFVKDVGSTLDFQWDWSDWLALGETIVSHEVAVPPDDLVIASHSEADGVVTAWISGGEDGATYMVSCTIETSDGRIDERDIIIQCVAHR